MTDERLAELMVKVVDGIASPAEKEELMQHVVAHPDLRRELEAHQALKAVTDGWVQRLELDLAEDAHRASAGFRLESALGVALLVLGLGLLSGWGLVELALDPEVPWPLRVGGAASVAGSIVLLAAALRWRWKTAPQDRYTEVVR